MIERCKVCLKKEKNNKYKKWEEAKLKTIVLIIGHEKCIFLPNIIFLSYFLGFHSLIDKQNI